MAERASHESGKAEFMRQAGEAYERMMLEDQEQMITFEQMEDRALEVGGKLERWLMAQRLEQAAQRKLAATACCPRCHKPRDLGPPEEREVLGRVGEVKLSRAKGYCASCRKAFFPSGRTTQIGP